MMRTAYEALDSVDLLATGEEEAAKWMFTEKGLCRVFAERRS